MSLFWNTVVLAVGAEVLSGATSVFVMGAGVPSETTVLG